MIAGIGWVGGDRMRGNLLGRPKKGGRSCKVFRLEPNQKDRDYKQEEGESGPIKTESTFTGGVI